MELPNLRCRISDLSDVPAILSFIAKMGFNERTKSYWQNNRLRAAICTDRDNKIVGAIPIFPRKLILGSRLSIEVWNQTVVAVSPNLRSKGIGTDLQEFLRIEASNNQVCLMSVYRRDETSQAYHWYSKNQFEDILPIRSLTITPTKCDQFLVHQFNICETDDMSESIFDLENLLEREESVVSCGSYKSPDISLSKLVTYSPYSRIYRFYIAKLKSGHKLLSFALMGIGQLHSEGERIEILAHEEREPDHFIDLVKHIIKHAHECNYSPVRISVSAVDSLYPLLCKLGFNDDWGFKFRVCGVDLRELQKLVLPERINVCFRISEYGDYALNDQTSSVLTLTYSQYLLLMLFRLDLQYQITQGLIVYEGNDEQYERLVKYFKPRQWEFKGIDYC